MALGFRQRDAGEARGGGDGRVGSGSCAAGSAGPERRDGRDELAAWAAWDGGAERSGLVGRERAAS